MCISLVTEHLINTTGADILAGRGGSHDNQTLIFLKMVQKVNGRVEIGLREFYINKEVKIKDFEYLCLLLIKYVNFCYLNIIQ